MQQFPGKFVSIAIGTNDINRISWHAATTGELDAMQSKMERIINEALAAGKTVIVPTLRWCTTNAYTAANMAAWKTVSGTSSCPSIPPCSKALTCTRPRSTTPSGSRTARIPTPRGPQPRMTTWVDWATANVYTLVEYSTSRQSHYGVSVRRVRRPAYQMGNRMRNALSKSVLISSCIALAFAVSCGADPRRQRRTADRATAQDVVPGHCHPLR